LAETRGTSKHMLIRLDSCPGATSGFRSLKMTTEET
jgi:hypothetical protein